MASFAPQAVQTSLVRRTVVLARGPDWARPAALSGERFAAFPWLRAGEKTTSAEPFGLAPGWAWRLEPGWAGFLGRMRAAHPAAPAGQALGPVWVLRSFGALRLGQARAAPAQRAGPTVAGGPEAFAYWKARARLFAEAAQARPAECEREIRASCLGSRQAFAAGPFQPPGLVEPVHSRTVSCRPRSLRNRWIRRRPRPSTSPRRGWSWPKAAALSCSSVAPISAHCCRYASTLTKSSPLAPWPEQGGIVA